MKLYNYLKEQYQWDKESPIGTVIIVKQGSSFSGKSFYYVKTSTGWYKADIEKRHSLYFGKITKEKIDLKELNNFVMDNKISLVTDGIKNNIPKHPIHLESLPIGSIINYKTKDYEVTTKKTKDGFETIYHSDKPETKGKKYQSEHFSDILSNKGFKIKIK